MSSVPTAPLPHLSTLAEEAAERGWKLRLAAPRPLGIWGLRVVVAKPVDRERAEWLGELKGWALPQVNGLRLDTLRAGGKGSEGAAPLLLATACAWAMECTPCRRARFLAIHDNERQHRRLIRYFRALGFEPLRELGSAPADWAPRLIWGGSGLLMEGDCEKALQRCASRWRRS